MCSSAKSADADTYLRAEFSQQVAFHCVLTGPCKPEVYRYFLVPRLGMIKCENTRVVYIPPLKFSRCWCPCVCGQVPAR